MVYSTSITMKNNRPVLQMVSASNFESPLKITDNPLYSYNPTIYPLVNKHSYWKLPFIVDLPMKNGDVPSFFVYQRVASTWTAGDPEKRQGDQVQLIFQGLCAMTGIHSHETSQCTQQFMGIPSGTQKTMENHHAITKWPFSIANC